MTPNEFESRVKDGGRNEYVDEELLKYIATELHFRMVDKPATEKDEIDQSELVSVSLPKDTSDMLGKEIEERVKDHLLDGSRDIQFYQLRHNGETPTVIECWRHGSGYSAFALSQ